METYCEQSRKKTSSSVAANLEHGRNIPRAGWKHSLSKNSSCTVEDYFERSKSIPRARHDQNRPRARLKHYQIMVETLLEHGRNIPRAQSKYNSSTVKRYVDHGKSIARAHSQYNLSAVAE